MVTNVLTLFAMTVGTFFALGGVADIAGRAVVGADRDPAAIFPLGLGAIIIWLGARRRLRWAMPLGIVWIVVGFFTCMAVPGLLRAARVSESSQIAESLKGFLATGVLAMVSGGILVVYQKLLDKQHTVEPNQQSTGPLG